MPQPNPAMTWYPYIRGGTFDDFGRDANKENPIVWSIAEQSTR